MNNFKILIIDDEIEVAEAVACSLEALSIPTPSIISNGMEGLQLIKRYDYDVIICDISMPEMNGIEVIKEVRNNKILTPFIFFTGFGNKDLEIEALRYGAFGLVNKPNYEELIELLKKIKTKDDAPDFNSLF